MAGHSSRQYITARTVWYAVFLAAIVGLSLTLSLPYPYYLVAFALPIGVLVALLTITYPYFGLIVYSVFFLVRPQEFVGVIQSVPFPLERTFALLLIAIMVIKLIIRERGRLKLRNLDYALVAFLVISFLSVPFSIWVGNAWTSWMKLFRLFIIYLLMTQIVDTKGKLKFLVFFIILTSAFHASASVFNYYRGIAIYRMGIERAIGLDESFGAPNSLAATMVYTLPFLYYTFTKYRSLLLKVLMIGMGGIMLWCIILTGSRTGMLGVLFLSILIIWRSRHRAVALVAIGILVVATWTIMPDQYRNRFESTADLDSATGAAQSARGRITGMINGVIMLTDRPLLGYGIGNFGIATGLVYGEGWFQSHSLPGQMLGELGLLGLFAFIAWMYYLFGGIRDVYRFYIADATRDPYMADLALSLKIQLFCLFFMGLGGHNLYRFNWFVISALTVIMLKLCVKEIGEKADHAKTTEPTTEAQLESHS